MTFFLQNFKFLKFLKIITSYDIWIWLAGDTGIFVHDAIL